MSDAVANPEAGTDAPRLHMTLRALEHPGLRVTMFDGDTVSASNIGRQRFTAAEVGSYKSVALINRVNLFYGLRWEGVPYHWTPDVAWPSLMISATDSAAVRHRIAEYGQTRGRSWGASLNSDSLWLDFGNGRTKGQAILGHLSPETRGDLRLPHIIDLYPDMADDPNDGPSCSVAEAIRQQAFGVNAALVTNAFATLVWPLFRAGQIDRHGLFMDVGTGEMTPLTIDPMAWQWMGYVAETAESMDNSAAPPEAPRTSLTTD